MAVLSGEANIHLAEYVPEGAVAGLRKVLVCGPVAVEGQPARGGFESANLRTLEVLRLMGIKADALRYPEASGGAITKSIAYLGRFLAIGAAILSGNSRGCVIHLTPFGKQFTAAECVVALLARLKGYRLVMDLRAGGLQRRYRAGTALSRAAFRLMLRMAHGIAYEGPPYDAFLAEIAPKKPRFWLPNFVMSDTVEPRNSFEPRGPNLVYVGLVSEPKGALAALALARLVHARLPGTRLTFIGRKDPAITPLLEKAGSLEPWVEFTGALQPERICAYLDRSHYFVFLSLWRGEGHSNALTEAMARGCVPIVTRHGFSAHVVRDQGFIVDDRDDGAQLEAAADWMVSRWNAADWMVASWGAVARVADNFTDDRTRETLRAIYQAALQ